MSNREKWADNLRRKMEHYEESVPETMLDDIMKKTFLAESSSATKVSEHRFSNRSLIFKSLSVAALLLLIAFASVRLLRDAWNGDNNLRNQQEIVAVVQNDVSNETNVVVNNETNVGVSNSVNNEDYDVTTIAVKRDINDTEKIDINNVEKIYINDIVKSDVNIVEKSEVNDAVNIDSSNKKSCKDIDNEVIEDETKDVYVSDINAKVPSLFEQLEKESEKEAAQKMGNYEKSKKNYSRFLAELSVSGLGKSQNSQAIKGGGYSARRFHCLSASPDGNPYLNLRNEKQEDTHIKHKSPVRAGIKFTYMLNQRIGIESGLSYARLSSVINNGDNHNDVGEENDQVLQYLGVPVNLVVKLADTKLFSFYANTGAMVEKCISGKLDTRMISNGKVVQQFSSNLHLKKLQWSLLASAGVQLNCTKRIGIFAEPGISYHFKNNEKAETIYKDRPLDFNFMFGLRFNFQ